MLFTAEPDHVPKVFISYRREDAAGYAGRLYDRLQQEFGRENVFIDVDSLQPGDDFVEAITERLSRLDVMLVVIGPRWLAAADEQGRPRLQDPADFVRLEIQAALEHKLPTVPVLVQRATMPRSQDLPEPLNPLVRRQAIELSDSRWVFDVGRLVDTIKRVPPHSAAAHEAPPPEPQHGSSAGPIAGGPSGNGRFRWSLGHSLVVAAIAISIAIAIAIFSSQQKPSVTSDVETGASTGQKETSGGSSAAAAGAPSPDPANVCGPNNTDGCARACEGGNAVSCTDLGYMYEVGSSGLVKDEAQAVALYRRGCDLGNGVGCSNLAYMYEMGRGGLAKDEAQAVALYRRGCESGDGRGCTSVGFMYETGRGGLPKDEAQAVMLYSRGCESGHAIGCSNLAFMYEMGRGGLTKDEAQAVTLYRRGCDSGDPRGCTSLGYMHETGRGGLAKDEAQAVALYRRGCEGGNAVGCSNLAFMYESGRGGLVKDESRAMEFYKRACDGGDSRGCTNSQRK